MKKLQKIRNLKFSGQSACCYYCGQPMWCENPSRFAKGYGLTLRQARYLQATAEHLVARCDGGGDVEDNIVATCRFCNDHRHRAKRPLAPEAYASKVQSRLSQGRWHGLRLGDGKVSCPVTPANAGA